LRTQTDPVAALFEHAFALAVEAVEAHGLPSLLRSVMPNCA
jgi:hypothetical protein